MNIALTHLNLCGRLLRRDLFERIDLICTHRDLAGRVVELILGGVSLGAEAADLEDVSGLDELGEGVLGNVGLAGVDEGEEGADGGEADVGEHDDGVLAGHVQEDTLEIQDHFPLKSWLPEGQGSVAGKKDAQLFYCFHRCSNFKGQCAGYAFLLFGYVVSIPVIL